MAACADAIELAPDFLGPCRTRAEAYRRLGMDVEADSDHRRLTETRKNLQLMNWESSQRATMARRWQIADSVSNAASQASGAIGTLDNVLSPESVRAVSDLDH